MAFPRLSLSVALALSLSSGIALNLTGSASGQETPDFTDDSASAENAPLIWTMPQLQDRLVKLRVATAVLFQQERFAEAEKAAQQAVELIPHDAAGYYLLASTQARQGKTEEALENLSRAVDRGYNKSQEMSRDPNLSSLNESLRFAELIAAASVAEAPPNPWAKKIVPDEPEDGIVTVSAENTGWQGQHGLFLSAFKVTENASPDAAVLRNPLAAKINKWYHEGTAAGNHGDFYDNHDGTHSMAAVAQFPQLTQIKFDAQARERNLHSGLQTRFIYNGIVMGNSSTAMVHSVYWRSQPRLAYVNKRHAGILYLQYINNHIYCYPEHRDYDPKHGDVYSANTPYVLISQGSSGSDRPAMNAILLTLAAFRPEVKTKLAKSGALMPTLQLIARFCHDNVKGLADYMSGKAHPTVFDATGFNAARMVDSAHGLTEATLPPLVKLNVVEDDPSQVGREYFDIGPRQEIFTTPCAIARVHRTTNYTYRMVVSAEDSSDLNDRKLTYHWRVLRGDPRRIKIKKLNDNGSVVELLVPYHEKRKIGHGSELMSNRVDIGCFVHNGLFYSAPAFVTFFSLANEQREYRADEKIAWVEYKDPTSGGDYVDPMIDVPKTWKDTYHYDDNDQLIGWTRERGEQKEEFTADGALIVERDDSGRALKAQAVGYRSESADARSAPRLKQVLGNQMLHYTYDSPEDRIGTVDRREAVNSN